MCEINPMHKHVFRLEAFTSDTNMSKEEFDKIVAEKLLQAEMALNLDMRFRFHLHDDAK